MDFSAWNYAKSFRLHEAACLIAGVMPIAKKFPTSEELPPQAKPILVRLMSAYTEWLLQQHSPLRPKALCLEGCLEVDGTVPEFVLNELTGALVSREALHRFLTDFGDVGHQPGYDFGPIGGVGQARQAVLQSQGAQSSEAQPEAADRINNTIETKEQRQDRRLQACIDAGLPMSTKAALSRLPNGVGGVADKEGVSRQAFSADVKAALERREIAKREGVVAYRA
ncbi:hypothetical protein ACFIQF_19260 [Comamonas sp. J-3]|uniref:hypothetical protein n=1 Tax=Comamonas trifloxystrobinivorans TaxID=3350256 RepID=UPI0037269878